MLLFVSVSNRLSKVIFCFFFSGAEGLDASGVAGLETEGVDGGGEVLTDKLQVHFCCVIGLILQLRVNFKGVESKTS